MNSLRMKVSTLEALQRYRILGIKPGDFLTAVLNNDLIGAVGYADEENLAALPEIVRWVYNELPAGAWRTKANIDRWIEIGGINGHQDRQLQEIENG